jgi:hypothetical protein
MIEIVWVYPESANDVWPLITDGLNQAMNNSDNLVTEEFIKYKVDTGTWSLFVLTKDEDYAGFAIGEVLDSARGKWYNIPFAYSKYPDVDLHSVFLPYIEDKAKKGGFVGVKFISKRPGYLKKARKHGYETQFVVYKKEF